MLNDIYKALKKEKDLETFYGNKKKTFVISAKKIDDAKWAGIVRKENKVMGYWFCLGQEVLYAGLRMYKRESERTL